MKDLLEGLYSKFECTVGVLAVVEFDTKQEMLFVAAVVTKY